MEITIFILSFLFSLFLILYLLERKKYKDLRKEYKKLNDELIPNMKERIHKHWECRISESYISRDRYRKLEKDFAGLSKK